MNDSEEKLRNWLSKSREEARWMRAYLGYVDVPEFALIDELERQEWAPIPGFDGYLISKLKWVVSVKRKNVKVVAQNDGRVQLRRNGKGHSLRVIDLVVEAFGRENLPEYVWQDNDTRKEVILAYVNAVPLDEIARTTGLKPETVDHILFAAGRARRT